MSADPALDLVVAYLRLNGYVVLTEQELHVREHTGFRSLTDIDIIAVRPQSDTSDVVSRTPAIGEVRGVVLEPSLPPLCL